MAKAFDFKKATLLLAGVFVLFAGAFVFSQNAEALVCSQYSFDALGSCTVDSDCGGVNDKCVSGECYEYTGSTTCPSDSATCQDSDTKQTTTYSCKPPEQDGGCQATTTSTDCASGQMCSAGVCTADTQSPNVGQVNQGTATVGTAVTFSASVTDNVSVTECVLVIDGVDQEGTMSGTPGSSITASKSYTFQSVGDGSYGVGVRCKDAANNSASSIRQVTVSAPADTTPPTVGLISPTSVTQGQSTTFSASVSDNVAVTACDFYTSAGNQGSMSINSSQGIASKSFTFNSTTSGVYARCTDGTNSTEGSRVTVTVNPPADDINPVVSANNASSSWFSSRTTTLSASDTGGSGLAQARYSWDSNAMDGSCTSGGTVFTNGIELTVSQGSHRLFLCARDGNSNVGTWDSGANQYRVDSTKPVSNFGASTPAAGSLQTATFTVYPTDSDTGGSNLATCYYAVYSDPSGWTVYNTTRTCGGSLVITVGADQNCRDIGTGKCQVNIYSRDGAGNTSDISLRSYSIDYSALTITPSSKSFGSVNTGESSSQVFAVQNTSSATISGQATIVDSGTSNADLDTVFSCSGCGSYSLSAGQTMNITITFQPTDDVSYGNDLLITASQGREARAALSGTGVSATPQCFAPQNLLCTYNASANTLNLQWNSVVGASSYKMEWARFDKNYGDTTGTTGGTSRIVSGTSGNTFGLTTNTNYKLRAQAETSTGICAVPGALSADILCATGSCSKGPTSLANSYSVGVPTASGTKSCTVNITHIGSDLSDSSMVLYESQASSSASRTIAMSDDAAFCADNLVYKTDWSIPFLGGLAVQSSAQSRSAANDLLFGYNVSTAGSTCVIQSVQQNSSCAGLDPPSICEPPVVADRSATKDHVAWAHLDLSNVYSNFTYKFAECTSNAHCTSNSDADPNKAYCNVDADSNGTGDLTANFPVNTCIDSAPPVTTMEDESLVSPAPGTDPLNRFWFRQGIYTINVTDSDSGTAGLQRCDYLIRDESRKNLPGYTPRTGTRTCNGDLIFTVGTVGSGADCESSKQTLGLAQCYIRVGSVDYAGNFISVDKYLSIDAVAPTAR